MGCLLFICRNQLDWPFNLAVNTGDRTASSTTYKGKSSQSVACYVHAWLLSTFPPLVDSQYLQCQVEMMALANGSHCCILLADPTYPNKGLFIYKHWRSLTFKLLSAWSRSENISVLCPRWLPTCIFSKRGTIKYKQFLLIIHLAQWQGSYCSSKMYF